MASDSSSNKKMKMVDGQKEKTIVHTSSIPNDVIGNIISFLPIKKAFSLSLTSRGYSDAWKYCRDLSFDIDYRTIADPANVFGIVNKVMDEHRGLVIERFKIIVNPSGKEDQVHDWVRKAIAKGLQELNLDFSSGNLRFVFPANVLDGARLNVLKVCYCELDSLKQFDALRYLKTLSVEDVFVPRYFPDELFSNCLLLENLKISNSVLEKYLIIQALKLKNFKTLKVINCGNLLYIYIATPSLQVFHYIGETCCIFSLQVLSKIEELVLHFNQSRSFKQIPDIDDLLFTIRPTKVLSISSPVVETICAKYFNFCYQVFSLGLENLNELRLSLGGPKSTLLLQSTTLDPYDIARFLNKSPRIEKLTIDFGVFPMVSGPYWELAAKQKFKNYTTCFNSLKSIRFINFKFLNLEILLANFIIESAKHLEQCIIVKAKRYPGAMKEELDFISSVSSKNFMTAIYLHDQFTSY